MPQFDPTTEPELRQALATVLRRAYGNGVSVTDRGIEIRNQDLPDWELMVYELTPPPAQ